MLLNPIQNEARFNLEWTQVRPRITQMFGKNPQIYEQFGMKAHNGIDFGIPVGTKLFAPCDGYVSVKKNTGGYGWHIKLRAPHKALECVLGHMSSFNVTDGAYVHMGDLLGCSGNTGFSTGAHLHLGVRRLDKSEDNIWKWTVKEYDNGYFGYFDPASYLLSWKGGLIKNTL